MDDEHEGLRARARESLSIPDPGSLDEARKALYELELHRVELAMQCEELEQTQRELERSHAAYRQLYDEAPVGYFTCTTEGRITQANAGMQAILGCTGLQLIDTAVASYASEQHRDSFHLHVTGLVGHDVSRSEMQLRHSDGSLRDVLLITRAHRDDQGTTSGLWVCAIDVTEQRRAEAIARVLTERTEAAQLRVSRLESIGHLAGGIAHDFNNVLTGILSAVSLARLDPSQADELLEDAEAATRRGAELANQLLTFARGGQPVRKTFSLSQLLHHVTPFALRGSNVKLELSVPVDLWATNGDEGQIGQVIQNLVINAREAMPEGGRIRVSASNVSLDGLEGLGLPAGDFVRVTVKDEGTGISDDALEHIFDPYFSTKGPNSGLGLAVVFSALRRHGGTIDVVRPDHGGTSMQVYLQATAAQVPSEARPSPSFATERSGRVLVLDDDPGIRKVVARALLHAGYDVEVFADGAAAIDSYREAFADGRRFDVVLLDLTLPGGVSGHEVLVALLRLDPTVRGVVMSGYSDDAVMADAHEHGFCGVLPKPFDSTGLLNAVREAFDIPPAS